MKTLLKIILFSALVGLSGCGASVPDCDDPDVAELVIKIIEDNNRDNVLQKINRRLEREQSLIERYKSELQVAVTAEQRETEIKRITDEIQNLNEHVGLPISNTDWYTFRNSALKHGWQGTKYSTEMFSAAAARKDFADAWTESDLETIEKLNEYVELPKDNRSQNNFDKTAEKHGWHGTKYGDSDEAFTNFSDLQDDLKVMKRLNPADEKQRVITHNQRIIPNIEKYQENIDDLNAAMDYVTTGVFTIESTRMSNHNKDSGVKKCESQLKFLHPLKMQLTEFSYSVALTTEDEIYVRIYSLPDVYGIDL